MTGEGARFRTLYGRRHGKKLRPGQQSLLETLLPKLLVPVAHSLGAADHTPLDLPALFGRPADIGWRSASARASIWSGRRNAIRMSG
jgi:hypothetical protein